MVNGATVGELLDEAELRIRESPHVDLWRTWVARVDAEELLAAAVGTPADDLDPDTAVTRGNRARFARMLARRVAGEPIVLIRGYMEFAGLRLVVRPGVFTPRSSSELLAGEALRRLRPRRRPTAVDVACGAGAVALAVASKLPQATVVGLDISAEAVRLGRHNARRLGLKNVSFSAGDLLARLPEAHRGGVDVFTIHPPYVARRLVATLSREIRDYEPAHSLTDRSVDGLGLVRRLADEGRGWLRPGGWLLVEVSSDLARKVRGVMVGAGYREVRSHRDRVGATRVVAGRLPA
ncbi:MAG: peptide chain release factor N(5)-glutamine methyltransferase [Candidatus Dormibacteraeota bacterium]|nr:peptide chain release factor N(5)-glutamine methyltransferase [Candidatus Dormibacteraeota bacterium]